MARGNWSDGDGGRRTGARGGEGMRNRRGLQLPLDCCRGGINVAREAIYVALPAFRVARAPARAP
jgi:hypothetical protein